jgi:tripartite-type tricarboxylate transporter receptor subunit TctC
MRKCRRVPHMVLALAVIGTCLTLPTSTGFSQGYPQATVRIVVPAAPGGSNDILARFFAAKLQERFRQAFVVENKPGANSAIGATFVARSNPDGYTLIVTASGALTVNPVLSKGLPYDPVRDFEPIALLGSFPLIVTVPATSPATNLRELLQLATKNKDGMLDHGVGSTSFQLAADAFASAAQIKFLHVNYRSSAPVVNALLGEQVQVGILDSAAVMGQIKAGALRALAVTTSKRAAAFPDIPTVAESGFAGYDVAVWTALLAPKGTPEHVLSRLRAAVADFLQEKDTTEKLRGLGMDVGNANSAALAKRIEADIARWAEVAKTADIKLE